MYSVDRGRMYNTRNENIVTLILLYYPLRDETYSPNYLHTYSYLYYQVRTITFLPHTLWV
jgi:hypothetical protein